MQKRWKILSADTATVTALHDSLRINRTLCQILVQRGIDDFDKAKQYFRPRLSDLHDPWLMKDMRKAVDRLLTAFAGREKILVFGDYDVDGTTSVASMFGFLSSVYDQVDFYIPHRYREGYGVSRMGIDYAKETGVTLIVSLDCGIKSVELIGYAKEQGIDFIVCDHHLPGKDLPDAVAILNPKQADCAYPYKELCGCGVGFKLMMAMAQEIGLPDTAYLVYLDLVATAIAADIVPITGENRTLAYYGLIKVNEDPCPGIKALMQLAGIKKKMHVSSLVFVIAPRVNAAGRMDDARKAVQLFIEKDYDKALAFAEMLHSDNMDRKEADSSITEEALALIRGDENHLTRKTTVVFQEHWHKGVVGIVASRLIESFYRPTIVLTRSGDYIAGSARSVAGFNLYEAIYACREHLLGYGGHFAAAGMTLLPEKVQAFSDAFEKEVGLLITEEQLIPEIVVDAEIGLNEINPNFYSILSQMEPFGPENMRPVFIVRKAKDTGASKIVKEQHLRFVVRQNNTTLTGIGFNMAASMELLRCGQPVDILFTIDENEWNGEKSLQMKVVDCRLSVD
ncbi:single-stranded-DNA-specific exonuclease RecJ [Sediminibacterium soli]|uniref:single-stranded-DNA-specific exonuclease RecJ n=1 Tax=Sediminibacterium soli TaxID=2698829 RepID=UPI00137B825D|nr:single-stranded-DNA-specific exonuclease RecJ [Sediminibacterium soli]NCI47161.1 single-stranded-DNA-specific exonuclease RecJ [Sediminibacterium soli]